MRLYKIIEYHIYGDNLVQIETSSKNTHVSLSDFEKYNVFRRSTNYETHNALSRNYQSH